MKIRGNTIGTTMKPEKVLEKVQRIITFREGHSSFETAPENGRFGAFFDAPADSFNTMPLVGDLVYDNGALYEVTSVNGNGYDIFTKVFGKFLVNLADLGELKGIVTTVNGIAPDASGNVEIEAGSPVEAAVRYTPQTLNSEQQTQARENIGVYSFVTPQMFGAVGDGKTDDTEAFRSALSVCNTAGGGTLVIPQGKYLIDAIKGLEVPSFTSVIMDDAATLKVIPNEAGFYRVFDINGKINVSIHGGCIQGDKGEHTGTTGEAGIGIRVISSENIKIDGVTIYDTWGDGIYVGAKNDGTNRSKNVTVSNCTIHNAGRNGISVVGCVDFLSDNCTIYDIQDKSPATAIDVEVNNSAEANEKITINRLTEWNCKTSIKTPNSTQYLSILDCDLESQVVFDVCGNARIHNTKMGFIEIEAQDAVIDIKGCHIQKASINMCKVGYEYTAKFTDCVLENPDGYCFNFPMNNYGEGQYGAYNAEFENCTIISTNPGNGSNKYCIGGTGIYPLKQFTVRNSTMRLKGIYGISLNADLLYFSDNIIHFEEYSNENGEVIEYASMFNLISSGTAIFRDNLFTFDSTSFISRGLLNLYCNAVTMFGNVFNMTSKLATYLIRFNAKLTKGSIMNNCCEKYSDALLYVDAPETAVVNKLGNLVSS